MGIVTSFLSGEQEEIHEVVLVPPLFERDHKGRSRLAKSSYDFLFIKPNLRWLFNDYIPVGAVKSILYFSPPEDPRISVTARFKASVDRGNKYVQLGDCKQGTARSPVLGACCRSNSHDINEVLFTPAAHLVAPAIPLTV